jgi:PhzF family phenazine biosynthesis protein
MKSITFKLYQVDAFASELFGGNPAGVCLITQELPDELLQKIAMEMNLSETAFPLPLNGAKHSGTDRFNLRWFTPACEVPLCGHATLATSHVLFEEIGVSSDELKYQSLSGPLKAIREPEGIRLDFPLNRLEPVDAPLELMSALGIEDWDAVEYCEVTENMLVRVGSTDTLAAIEPDFQALLNAAAPWPVCGVVLTSHGKDGFDFFSRYFAPWVGVDEDPVTGMAHTMLTDYWSRTLNKNELRAYQASKRGGEMTVRRVDDRAHLIGKAITVFRTELDVPLP